LWHKENAFVLCKNGDLQKYSAATGIRHDPKPLSTDMMGDTSPQNDTDPLQKEYDQLDSKGGYFSESTVATSEYVSIGSIKDGGTANARPDISDVDAGWTAGTELSGPSRSLVVGHDNKTSIHRKGAMYEGDAVFGDTNVKRIGTSVEMPDEDAEKYSGSLEKPLKSDRDKESAGNCTECCGKNTCDGANDETGAVGPAIPSDSVANLTAQDSTIRSGIDAPMTRDEHNSGSLHNAVGSVTPPSRDKTPSVLPDGAKHSAEKLNATSPLQSTDSNIKADRVDPYPFTLGTFLFVVMGIFACVFGVYVERESC
jgi:hypothetical protein